MIRCTIKITYEVLHSRLMINSWTMHVLRQFVYQKKMFRLVRVKYYKLPTMTSYSVGLLRAELEYNVNVGVVGKGGSIGFASVIMVRARRSRMYRY